MCGIVGILSSNPSLDEIRRINDLLIHRGPDDSGIYLGPGIGLASRRLSIIDLDAGKQPISNEDQRIWLVCNGEIVNAPVLRNELEISGHTFRTHTDIEVIVHAYEQWGEDFVNRLQGMFAFALWDTQPKLLLLARDRFGIKPLYYASSNGEFAFSSEIKPVFQALPGLPCQANLEAIWRLFEINFIPAPLTPFQGVHALLPAHVLRVKEGDIALRTYWRPDYPQAGEHIRVDPGDAAEEFIARLSDTLSAWRMSDVPVGALLSGGIDSASMAALLSRIDQQPVHTFNIGFDFKSLDETASAREIAHYLGCSHHEIAFTFSNFDCLPQVIDRLEQPQLSTVCLSLFRLYQACHEAGFKVIVSGEGADELLGGYPWYRQDQRIHPYVRMPKPVRSLLSRTSIHFHRDKRRGLAMGMPEPVDRFLLWLRETCLEELANLLNIDPFTPMTEIWRETFSPYLKGLHPFDQFSFLDSQTRLPDWINLQGDRMSMAHSVESRPPFLDHLLWEYVAKLPPGLKLSPSGNKYLLRLGMKNYLPPQVRNRPKRGLSSPVNALWRTKKLPGWIEEYLEPSALEETGYFNSQEVNRLLDTHRSHRANFSSLLTGVLTTQIWHYRFMNENSFVKQG